MTLRRAVLTSGACLLCALAARRAHALRDPSELSVGGSAGAHDAHIACGPDVRVRHASGGVHYERTFEKEGEPGRGASLDVRGGVGSMRISGVSEYGSDATSTALFDNERDRTYVLATGQVLFGYDWKTFALRGGLGYFGLAGLTDDNRRFHAKYYPLPALDMRIGRRDGFRGSLGLGAPPIPGLARWYSAYGLVSYRFKEGGDLGGGLITTFGGTLDQRTGFVFHGMFPITQSVHVGGFGMIDADDRSRLTGFNWSAGAGIRVMLDQDD